MRMGAMVTRPRVRVRRSLPRVHTGTTVTSVAAWLGLLLVLGLPVVNASEAALGEPAFWADYRWGMVAVVVLAVVQGLVITALLVKRRAHLKAESKKSDHRTELLHTSRLAVVGQLSASIAHEINQPLGAILSNADAVELMLATAEPDLSEMRLILADIRKDGLRASGVVRQIETLARKRPLEFMEINLQDLCKDILYLVVPIARRRGVTIRTHFDPHVLLVRGDPVLLRQAILNLMLNAMDALVDVPAPQAVIELSTSSSRSGEPEVAVRDHGTGVPERYLGQLFDAFFTTKMHGLGLGLPIVRSIIESHGGRILVENHPEGGAVFRFTVPVTEVTGVANYPVEEPI